jgi:hypothetical protein
MRHIKHDHTEGSHAPNLAEPSVPAREWIYTARKPTLT